jgi:hypothetical protein
MRAWELLDPRKVLSLFQSITIPVTVSLESASLKIEDYSPNCLLTAFLLAFRPKNLLFRPDICSSISPMEC